MGLPQSWVIVLSTIGAMFGCICAALIYRRFVVMPDDGHDGSLHSDPIALEEARLRAAGRRERRLQQEMEQLSRALQERKDGLRDTHETQEELTHRIEGARTARAMGADNSQVAMMMGLGTARGGVAAGGGGASYRNNNTGHIIERRGMFSHMNTPRQQPSSARARNGGGVSARGNAGRDRDHSDRVGVGLGHHLYNNNNNNPHASPSIVPPLNFASINGSGGNISSYNGVAHHLDNDPVMAGGVAPGDIHADISKLSELAKVNPAVARELALGLAMRMAEEMDRNDDDGDYTPSDDDGSDDDDDHISHGNNHGAGNGGAAGADHHTITIHHDAPTGTGSDISAIGNNGGNGMGRRRRTNRSSSSMASARLALEALGGVPSEYKQRLSHGDDASGARKSGGRAGHGSGRAARAERRQREKKMVLSGRRQFSSALVPSSTSANTTTTPTGTSVGVIASSPLASTRAHTEAHHRTADDIRGDGWEHASARSLPTIGHDEDGIHMIHNNRNSTDGGNGNGAMNDSGSDIGMGLPPPKPIKIGSVPSASAVTEDDDDDDNVIVNDSIRNPSNPFEDSKRSIALHVPPSSSPTYGRPAPTPVASSSSSLALQSVPLPSSASASSPATVTATAPVTTSAAWILPVHVRTPVSPLSSPSPPFARSRGASLDSDPHHDTGTHPPPPPPD